MYLLTIFHRTENNFDKVTIFEQSVGDTSDHTILSQYDQVFVTSSVLTGRRKGMYLSKTRRTI